MYIQLIYRASIKGLGYKDKLALANISDPLSYKISIFGCCSYSLKLLKSHIVIVCLPLFVLFILPDVACVWDHMESRSSRLITKGC